MMGPEPMSGSAAGASPMRRFVATRISDAIAADLLVAGREGVVESVHHSAVNFRWQGRLITIAHESVGGLPNGLVLAPPVAFDRIGLTRGMALTSDGAALRVSAVVVVLLYGAATWSPAMPVTRGKVTVRVARARRAMQLAAAEAPRVGLGPLLAALAGGTSPVGALGRAAAAHLASVVDALRDHGPQRAVAAARPLIGLGPGATPSGDDLLVGLAAGLAATDHPLARPVATGVAANAQGMTTSLAEAFLAHAGRLEFAERVQRAALAVLCSSEAEMRTAVTAALGWGASSGVDLLVGLLVGIQADAPGLAECLRACANEGLVAA